jgi:hypothetical protein
MDDELVDDGRTHQDDLHKILVLADNSGSPIFLLFRQFVTAVFLQRCSARPSSSPWPGQLEAVWRLPRRQAVPGQG